MKQKITSSIHQCPECGSFFEPVDGYDVCEICLPSTMYARGAGQYEDHPFQPMRIDELTDCEDE